MNLALFGVTGRTGRHLLEQALAAGHQVTALARDPSRLAGRSDQLRIVQGDVRDAQKVAQTVAGAEAVLSVLGPAGNTPELGVSRGMENILAAMRQQGVRRLIVSAGAGVPDPRDAPRLFDKAMSFLVRTLSRHVYEDMLRTVELVRASNLDWTVVRVPMLSDTPAQGGVRAGWVGRGLGPRLARADLAAFILGQLADTTYLRQAPAISNWQS